MVEIKVEMKNSGSDFENALGIFLDGFLDAHPKKTWPSWFKTCTTYGGHLESERRWRFAFTAIPSSVLGPGDSWEITKNGSYVLVRTDVQTGEKRYVISNAPSEVLTIFEAVIDLSAKDTLVVTDTDLNAINGADLLPLQR